MSFSASWLALRAPADHAARSWALARRFAGHLAAGTMIHDLGAGTGATVRALGPLMPTARWTLVDGDARLLAVAPDGVATRTLDLATDLGGAIDGAGAITCSALLDLVSAEWLDRLVDTLVARRLPIYAALSFDGRHGWQPAHSDDGVIDAAFLQHQRQDKGFGKSLGPDAWRHVADRLREAGYEVLTEQSDWILGPSQSRLLEAMVDGIATAASEADETLIDRAEDWIDARRIAIAAQSLHLVVGHRDVLGLPR